MNAIESPTALLKETILGTVVVDNFSSSSLRPRVHFVNWTPGGYYVDENNKEIQLN